MEWSSIISNEWWQQAIAILILGTALIFFMKDRWRYDVIALLIMISIMILGLLPYETVLANFGHPVVVIVGCMFIISQALVRSGFIDAVLSRFPFFYSRPLPALLFLTVVVTLISGFVNNIGALAMVIPIALSIAKKNRTPVAFFLLPLAFASHLGGYLTLIGTPRNILISDYRLEATGTPFAMFDFLPVGGAIAVVGIIFIFLYALHFLPRRSPYERGDDIDRVFVTEVLITQKSKLLDMPVKKIRLKMKESISLLQVFRNNQVMYFEDDSLIHEGDIIQITGTETDLTAFTEKYQLQLTGQRAVERNITNNDDYTTVEVVVPSYAKLSGKAWDDISLADRFGTNFIGLFRKSFRHHQLLSHTKLIGNDILLLQGRRESLKSTVEKLGIIPIADSDTSLGRNRTAVVTALITIGAIITASLQIIPLPIIFLTTVALLVGSSLISLKQAYESIEWPVLVLLAGMITLGMALEASGAVNSLAAFLLLLSEYVSPVWLLALVLIVSMLLSDFINTTASAVIMAPIAVVIATTIGVSIDPFLMAVAIGASSAYLTPVGHESNAFVMQKGGYRFSDFTKMGLPLELLIIATAIPMILYIWPL
jgi:di/tricarboxylate transporter